MLKLSDLNLEKDELEKIKIAVKLFNPQTVSMRDTGLNHFGHYLVDK